MGWLEAFGCDVNLAPNLGGNHLAAAEERQGNVRGLFVFDLDSTLIQMECIDELARRAGVYGQVAVGKG